MKQNNDNQRKVGSWPAPLVIAMMIALLVLGAIIDLLAANTSLPDQLRWEAIIVSTLIISTSAGLLLLWRGHGSEHSRAQERTIAALRASEEEHRRTLEARVAERTTETLRHANAELARAARTKDEFLATMSHELRTPLNAILGMSESLLEEVRGPLNQRQQDSLRTIEASGRHLLTLINDILDLSKVEAGRLDLQRESVAVAEICQASLLFVKEQALRKSIKLALHLNDQAVEVEADARRLKQMLVNLLSNAVKFTPDHGQVSLEVTASPDASVISFVVADTGIGIAPEDTARLFQPFRQLDSSLSRQHEGSGLGLALVRKLAELHGGSVSVESELGTGSRFTIALPYALTARGAAPDDLTPSMDVLRSALLPTPPAQPAPTGMRVLLAEDNETNIIMLRDYLEDKGGHVAVAHNGHEAIEYAGAAHFDVILMDIQMPEMDGLEAIRRLRAMPAYAATPIIALTALAMPGDRERCLDAGASEYLMKPVSLRALTETIQRLLLG